MANLQGDTIRVGGRYYPLWLTSDEVAAILRVTRNTLYSWRQRGYGPPAVRIGGTLRYRGSDIQALMNGTTTEPA